MARPRPSPGDSSLVAVTYVAILARYSKVKPSPYDQTQVVPHVSCPVYQVPIQKTNPCMKTTLTQWSGHSWMQLIKKFWEHILNSWPGSAPSADPHERLSQSASYPDEPDLAAIEIQVCDKRSFPLEEEDRRFQGGDANPGFVSSLLYTFSESVEIFLSQLSN